jgi:hypothetical protein
MTRILRITVTSALVASFLLLSGCDETGKSTLAGGAIGAGAGAGIGALAGNAALGAGIGGAIGLLGGWLHDRNKE